MIKGVLKWIRQHYYKIIGSIAFYPAFLAVCFLFLSWLMLEIDFSTWGKHLKMELSWLSLKDASTARIILSTISGGIISLTVFSFSMVMIVLNQTASQLSNRILDSMIESRFQQIVLGFYIGTIVYSLFLLSTIRDINTGIYVPALSIYLLILLTIVDIFLFIYFIDYVTQTVKYNTVINRIRSQTLKVMQQTFCEGAETFAFVTEKQFFQEIKSPVSGYYQGFNRTQLIELAIRHNVIFSFLHEVGTYVLKGTTFLSVHGNKYIENQIEKDIFLAIDFYDGQPIHEHADYGFKQLSEVAIKALSPGINDPATAVLSLNALSDLFAYRLNHNKPAVIKDDNGQVCIFLKVSPFHHLFRDCISPIWAYGKADLYIQQAVLHMSRQLKELDYDHKYKPVFNALIDDAESQLKEENAGKACKN